MSEHVQAMIFFLCQWYSSVTNMEREFFSLLAGSHSQLFSICRNGNAVFFVFPPICQLLNAHLSSQFVNCSTCYGWASESTQMLQPTSLYWAMNAAADSVYFGGARYTAGWTHGAGVYRRERLQRVIVGSLNMMGGLGKVRRGRGRCHMLLSALVFDLFHGDLIIRIEKKWMDGWMDSQ